MRRRLVKWRTSIRQSNGERMGGGNLSHFIMDKRIDFDNGVKEETFYNTLTREFHIKRTVDIEPLLKLNQEQRNNDDVTKQGIKNGMWKVGSIPNIVLAQWIANGVDLNDTKAVLKELSKPENRRYRATNKRFA